MYFIIFEKYVLKKKKSQQKHFEVGIVYLVELICKDELTKI